MNVKTRTIIQAVATVVCAMIFMGCASFPRNQLPPAGSLQPRSEGTRKPTAGYSFSSGIDLFGKQEHQERARLLLEKEFVDALTESGYFASLSAGSQGELQMEVRLINSGSPAAMVPAFITGFSLYTIPSWSTDRYDITANVRATDGKEYTYQLTDSMTTVQWLPMILVFPFRNMVHVSKEVRRNIWRTLILRMQEDGVLPKPESAGSMSRLDLQLTFSSLG